MLESKTYEWPFDFSKTKEITGTAPEFNSREWFDVKWSEENRTVTLTSRAFINRSRTFGPSVANQAAFDSAFRALKKHYDSGFALTDSYADLYALSAGLWKVGQGMQVQLLHRRRLQLSAGLWKVGQGMTYREVVLAMSVQRWVHGPEGGNPYNVLRGDVEIGGTDISVPDEDGDQYGRRRFFVREDDSAYSITVVGGVITDREDYSPGRWKVVAGYLNAANINGHLELRAV